MKILDGTIPGKVTKHEDPKAGISLVFYTQNETS